MKTFDDSTIRISLVLPTEFSYAREVLKGIVNATRSRSIYQKRSRRSKMMDDLPWVFQILRGTNFRSARELQKWVRDFRPHGVIADIYDDRVAAALADCKTPFIELFGEKRRSKCHRIISDDIAVGELAALHLLSRGLKHFAYFGLAKLDWSKRREEGFRQEIQKRFEERNALPGQSTPTAFTFASFDHSPALKPMAATARRKAATHMSVFMMGTWIQSLPKPVGIFAANDLWGFELVQAARQHQLHVPDEVAVLGVDNDESLCEVSYPALSSIRLGGERMGHHAVTCMGRLLRGEAVRQLVDVVAPQGIVTRQSTDVLAVDDPDVRSLLRLIRQHACDGITVKQAMSSVAVNRRTMERRFINIVGHTPLDEMRTVRIERAKTLLQTNIPIYEVAERSGFHTPEYLATAFLRATGVSPTTYRRQFGMS